MTSALWKPLGKQGEIGLKIIFLALRLVRCAKYDVPTCLEAEKKISKFLVPFFRKYEKCGF